MSALSPTILEERLSEDTIGAPRVNAERDVSSTSRAVDSDHKRKKARTRQTQESQDDADNLDANRAESSRDNKVVNRRHVNIQPKSPPAVDVHVHVSRRSQRRNATRACNRCRIKRIKCIDPSPCRDCRLSNVECSFTGGDQRKRGFREYDTLLQERDVLYALIDSIRKHSADAACQTIEQGGDVKELAASLGLTFNLPEEGASPPESEGSETEPLENMAQHNSYPGKSGSSNAVKSKTRTHVTAKNARKRTFSDSMQGERTDRIVDSEHMRSHDATPYNPTMQTHGNFGNLPLSSAIVANGYPRSVQDQQRINFYVPEHYILPLIDADETPLDRVYSNFVEWGRREIVTSNSWESVAKYDNDIELLFRARSPDDPYNAATWAAEMARSFVQHHDVAVCAGAAVVLGRLMRWMLYPSPETYAQVPPFMRPTRLQRLVPHPSSIELFAWGSLRDACIANRRDWVKAVQKAGLMITSPWTESEIVKDGPEGRRQLTTAFAEHVQDLSNWHVGGRIVENFPEVVNLDVNVSDKDYIRGGQDVG